MPMLPHQEPRNRLLFTPGADLGEGCRGCAPPLPPRDDLRFSNTTGILQKKLWFIGVEVEQETSAPPPKKNPGSAPAHLVFIAEYHSKELYEIYCVSRGVLNMIEI